MVWYQAPVLVLILITHQSDIHLQWSGNNKTGCPAGRTWDSLQLGTETFTCCRRIWYYESFDRRSDV
jgi:hypothetical protein